MSKKHRVNRDIYEVISTTEIKEFWVVQVRELIQKRSTKYNNSKNARSLVAKQLKKLENIGALKSTGERQNKKYRKTSEFTQIEFILTDKRACRRSNKVAKSNDSTIISELVKEKTDIETELTIALAEVDEYRKLMNRTVELHQILKEPHAVAARKAASLCARLNVWSNTIKLVTQGDPKVC